MGIRGTENLLNIDQHILKKSKTKCAIPSTSCNVMIPLNHMLRKCTGGYKLQKFQVKINHQIMYMVDIKLFAKNEKELEMLRKAMKIYNQDIGIKFGIEKCATIKCEAKKRQIT